MSDDRRQPSRAVAWALATAFAALAIFWLVSALMDGGVRPWLSAAVFGLNAGYWIFAGVNRRSADGPKGTA